MSSFDEMKSMIIKSLTEFVDIYFQREVWTGKSKQEQIISSHDEAINTIFYDYGLDDFIEECEKNSYCENVIPSLKEFSKHLSDHAKKYDDSDNIEQLLESDEWLAIRTMSAKLILLLTECNP